MIGAFRCLDDNGTAIAYIENSSELQSCIRYEMESKFNDLALLAFFASLTESSMQEL